MEKSPSPSPFDDISPESIANIEKLKGLQENTIKVDEEWLILAEFAKHYGWQAYKDARDDKVKTDEMMTLIMAARKLDYISLYNSARASFIGAGSANSKKPSDTFNSLTRNIITEAKADE